METIDKPGSVKVGMVLSKNGESQGAVAQHEQTGSHKLWINAWVFWVPISSKLVAGMLTGCFDAGFAGVR